MAHTYILDRNTNFVTCAEPMPDASFSSGQADSFSLFQFGGTDGAAESSKAAENGLEGRTPTVLMTRELFFRLCEFSRNYQLSKDEAKELYLKTLNTIAPVWNVEAGNTKVSISETQTISESETTANSNTASPSTSENSANTDTTTDATSTGSDSSSSSDY